MHSYASDSADRQVSLWVIAGLAVGLTYLCNVVAEALHWKIPWWCEAPSVMSIYSLLLLAYNRWGWRRTIHGFRLSQIPDCNGTWYGNVSSTHNGGTEVQGMLVVHQTWKEIVIQFRTGSSASCSRMAALNVTPGASEGLAYEYINEPHATAVDLMHAHRGFAFLKLSADGQWLEGDYYTGRDRSNHGRLTLRRLARKRMDLQEAKAKHAQMTKAETK